MLPSITASTFSSRAISGSFLLVDPLYDMAEVTDVTRSALTLASSVVSTSVRPSA